MRGSPGIGIGAVAASDESSSFVVHMDGKMLLSQCTCCNSSCAAAPTAKESSFVFEGYQPVTNYAVDLRALR